MTSGVVVRVPAKINLHLAVGTTRADGFHDLCTVFHAVDLYDEVRVTPARQQSISVIGSCAHEVPADERNLAWRAAALLAEAAGIEPAVAIHLDKAIPVAAGMAGGSADAAATLVACAALWGTHLDLPLLAARLGSDVTFPLLGGTALGTGRGEIVEPVACAARLHWVLVLADHGISAGDAYRELDRQRGSVPPPRDPSPLLAALAAGDLDGVAAALSNDLQPAALAIAPALAGTLAAGVRLGALAGIVSGSGPTCAFLCAGAAEAEQLALDLRADLPSRDVRVAAGPTPGARVIG